MSRRANAGARRGTSALSKPVVPEATTANVANTSNAVNTATEKGKLEAGDFLALVTAGGQIKPLAVATLQRWLDDWHAAITHQPLPVDFVAITYTNTNPAAAFGYGTWVSVGVSVVNLVNLYVWRRTA